MDSDSRLTSYWANKIWKLTKIFVLGLKFLSSSNLRNQIHVSLYSDFFIRLCSQVFLKVLKYVKSLLSGVRIFCYFIVLQDPKLWNAWESGVKWGDILFFLWNKLLDRVWWRSEHHSKWSLLVSQWNLRNFCRFFWLDFSDSSPEFETPSSRVFTWSWIFRSLYDFVS